MNTLNRRAAWRTWPRNGPVKIVGGPSPPPPPPLPILQHCSMYENIGFRRSPSVMNTLSETICNSYPFKRDDEHQGRFHDMGMLRLVPPPAKERAVYISGSCNKIPLQNLNSIGSRPVVCLPIEWKSQSHSSVWVFNFHLLFCYCRLPFGATCIGRCTSLFMTNERRLGRRKSLYEWINAE